jgi:hypothetical protein
MAQVVSRKYSALFDFENEADAREAATLIKEPYRAEGHSHAGCRNIGQRGPVIE